jgi:anti-anti-sigma factor
MPAQFEAVLVGGCLRVSGELDASAVPTLHLHLAVADGCVDALDIGDVTFIDSAGLHGLMAIRRRYPTLQVRNATETARRLMDIVGVTELILPPQRCGR